MLRVRAGWEEYEVDHGVGQTRSFRGGGGDDEAHTDAMEGCAAVQERTAAKKGQRQDVVTEQTDAHGHVNAAKMEAVPKGEGEGRSVQLGWGTGTTTRRIEALRMGSMLQFQNEQKKRAYARGGKRDAG